MPEKEEFCSNLNMEDIIDSGYNHTERVYKDFEMTYFSDNMICILKAIHYY